MRKQIIDTVMTRGAGLAAAFLLVWLTARFMGAEIRGMISLHLFTLSMIAVVAGIAGGPVLVFLATRANNRYLLKTSILAAGLAALLVPPVMVWFKVLHPTLLIHAIIPGFFLAVSASVSSLLLGLGKLTVHNRLTLLQPVITSILLACLIFFDDREEISSYLISLYAGTLGLMLISFFAMVKHFFPANNLPSGTAIFKQQITQGGKIQTANIFQLLSQRAAFIITAIYLGDGRVGELSVAVAVAEALWVLSKSIATIQYGEISRSRNVAAEQELTKKFMLISGIGTLLLLTLLLLVPTDFYTWIFGVEYDQTRLLLLGLGPGILCTAIGTVPVHYFSGKGLNLLNAWSSLAGAIIAFAACYLFIPTLGIFGAALGTSAGYMAALFVTLYFYFDRSKVIGKAVDEA